MTVLDLKRVLSPDIKIEYVTYAPTFYDTPIDKEPEKRIVRADLDDEIVFINVLDDETIEVTI